MSDEIPQTDLQAEVKKEAAIISLSKALIGPADEFDPSLPLFLGTLKEEHTVIYTTAAAYLGMQDAQKEGNEREFEILKSRFEELREEHFKDVEENMLAAMLVNYFRFYFHGFDRTLVREATQDLVRNRNVTSTVALKNGQRMNLISPIIPSSNSKANTRERMRRTYLKASGEPDSFNVILPNSLIFMRVKIPDPVSLARLINDIVTKLFQYGERYNQSSIHLERAGIGKLITDFVLDRLSYHSVKGVNDPAELKKFIYSSDLNVLAQTLLATSSPKGVSYRMTCLANKCGWSQNSIIDPTELYLYVEEDQPAGRHDLLLRLINEGHKLSPEELADNPPVFKDKDGNEIDTSVEFTGGDGTGRLRISVPYLSEYFQSYDQMAARINPELRELAVQFPNSKVYAEKRREYLAQLRGHEYLQWFSVYEMDAPAGSEDEPEIIHRDEDPIGFDEGLMDIFNKDEDLYYNALQKVITLAPRMTYTFIGIRDDVCPGCKAKNEGILSDKLPSFTPIDPILNFFDHTRMMISIRTSQQTLQEERLS